MVFFYHTNLVGDFICDLKNESFLSVRLENSSYNLLNDEQLFRVSNFTCNNLIPLHEYTIDFDDISCENHLHQINATTSIYLIVMIYY